MKHLFDKHEPRSGKPVDRRPDADVSFISAGLKAAQHSQNNVRATVLEDVSEALACKPEDLNFLFKDTDDDIDSSIYDFPDSERRRKVIQYNNLDAAE